MPRLKYGSTYIKREFEIDQYLYLVKYLIHACWDVEEGGWYPVDIKIEWIERSDNNFEKNYPIPCDIPKSHLKEIENITPEIWEYELCGERPEP